MYLYLYLYVCLYLYLYFHDLHYGSIVDQLLCPFRANPIIQRSATASICIIAATSIIANACICIVAQHHHPDVVLCCKAS